MDILIIGGGGSSAVTARTVKKYMPRAQVQVYTKRKVAGYRPCELTYVLGGEIPSFETMINFDPAGMAKNNIFYHMETAVTEIEPQQQYVTVKGEKVRYDRLVIATGSEPFIPPIPGADGTNEFTLGTDMVYAENFLKALPQFKSAVIIGAGPVGLEAAEALVNRNYEDVWVVEAANQILPKFLDREMAQIVQDRLAGQGVNFLFNAQVSEIRTEEGQKIAVIDDSSVKADCIVYCTGFRPRNELARRCGLEIGETGGIKVDQFLRTSDPNIFAVGDVAQTTDLISGRPTLSMMGSNAVRTAKVAAQNMVSEKMVAYNGTVHTFAIKLAGLYIGTAGYNETARGMLLPDSPQVATASHRATVKPPYVNGKPIHIKLAAESESYRLIGVQLISEDPVGIADLDRLALAMTEQISLSEISLAETCYTPSLNWPYSPVAQTVDNLIYRLEQIQNGED
ncbi:FAD-dependent oxidoreductase [Metallumcola ferriviriculae]|uniref:FAD-dependent oxidoreductase n=1 Tax=Metallumcola ferriviriculae TaxID=3039180 RepID=A0AAU0UQI2_9FIRM|nr:FAD-dependent oxidoreductase [Desulfitibacteraceae bacterium MK1]